MQFILGYLHIHSLHLFVQSTGFAFASNLLSQLRRSPQERSRTTSQEKQRSKHDGFSGSVYLGQRDARVAVLRRSGVSSYITLFAAMAFLWFRSVVVLWRKMYLAFVNYEWQTLRHSTCQFSEIYVLVVECNWCRQIKKNCWIVSNLHHRKITDLKYSGDLIHDM